MTMEEKKIVLGTYAERLEKEIKKEVAVTREIEDDKATLKYVTSQKEAGTALENSAYGSYDEWTESINKEIKAGENRLKAISFKKIELEAIKAFIA